MKAISIIPHTSKALLTDVQEPDIQSPDQIKMKVLQVGICGTDREEVEGGRADPPAGKGELVIGHEMFGVVVAVGSAVKTVKGGDFAYVDGRVVQTTDIDDTCGEADFVFEATGIAKLQIQLIDTLAVNGIYVATGIPAGQRPMTIFAENIMQQLVLKNQILLGSVNASISHYKMAVDYLQASHEKWPGIIAQTITEKLPYTRFHEALFSHSTEEIKVVVEWA